MASTTSSTLRLIMQKGPRQGETLEFHPRSTVRIGRVVKGNNLPIKDSGISSKHLSIEFNSDSGRWLITDLESSNGTLLNSSQLQPLSPFELQSGNEIKIGELTSIRVEIVEISEQPSIRRNPRRQAAPKIGADLGVKIEVGAEECSSLGKGGSIRVSNLIEENVGKGVENGIQLETENRRGRGRGRQKKISVLEDENSGISDNVENGGIGGSIRVSNLMEENVGKGVENGIQLEIENRRGRGRGRQKKISVLEDENHGISDNVENLKPLQVDKRRTRSSKREEGEVAGQVETIPTRRSRRGKNLESVTENSVLEKVPESEALDMDTCKEVENNVLVENKKTRGGRGRKKKVDVECLDSAEDVVLDDKTTTEVIEQKVLEQAVDLREQPCREPIDGMKLSEETVDDMVHQERGMDCPYVKEGTCNELESDVILEKEKKSEIGEISKESESNNFGREEDKEAGVESDLEKMTLGEWFDYLEVYLPKQIHAVRDEIIADMRNRAKQYDEFVLQHKNDKGKLPMAT